MRESTEMRFFSLSKNRSANRMRKYRSEILSFVLSQKTELQIEWESTEMKFFSVSKTELQIV